MTINEILNSVKTVIDYDMNSRATLFVLVKSDKGNYSIRQAFRNIYGEYKGFTIVKLLRNKGEDVAKIEFENLMDSMK